MPFDRRRHGMIIGMGAAALVVESAEAARERGLQPICEVLGAVTANSAFHGTRLDVQHIGQVMEKLVRQAERAAASRATRSRRSMVFVSHETYTPARGGSASAEIHALRSVFGDGADQIVIANTKGFTGHAMGAGIEDVVAVKALETGLVPPVANFKELDPELGPLNLSKGGAYPVEYALRLGAGFGSQISMTLLRRVATRAVARPVRTRSATPTGSPMPRAWKRWLDRIAGHPRRTWRWCSARCACAIAGTLPAPTPAPVEQVAIRGSRASAAAPSPRSQLRRIPAAGRHPVQGAGSGAGGREDRLSDGYARPRPRSRSRPRRRHRQAGGDVRRHSRDLQHPARPNMKLRDFPTLAHVIGFVHERRPDLAAALLAPAAGARRVRPLRRARRRRRSAERMLDLVAEKTGYPQGHARPRSRPGSRPRRRHRQAGGDVRRHPRDLQHPAREHQAARLPDPGARHPVSSTTGARTCSGAAPRRTVDQRPPQPRRPLAMRVEERILDLVAEKTGYPEDMLDLDLDLEADLGVDTVKQAEMFAAIRETYNIARDDNLKLRDFPTLAHVIRFVYDRRPDLEGPVRRPRLPPAPSCTRRRRRRSVEERILALVVEKTGYPRTCSTSISTWKPTSASTPSSRRRCSRPSARPTTSRATRT